MYIVHYIEYGGALPSADRGDRRHSLMGPLGCIRSGPDTAIFGGCTLWVFPRTTTTPTRQCSPARYYSPLHARPPQTRLYGTNAYNNNNKQRYHRGTSTPL